MVTTDSLQTVAGTALGHLVADLPTRQLKCSISSSYASRFAGTKADYQSQPTHRHPLGVLRADQCKLILF